MWEGGGTGYFRRSVCIVFGIIRKEKCSVMNSIFSYVNYRRFLKDYYLKAKAEKKYFSYRYFSRRAGINSPNFLKVVIEGKRNLSSKTIEKFATALGLNQQETVFFRRLVMFNQAKTASEKQESYILLREMANHVRMNAPGSDFAGFLNKWYINAVRELMADDKSEAYGETGKGGDLLCTESIARPLAEAANHPADHPGVSFNSNNRGVLTLWPQLKTAADRLARVQTFTFQVLSTLTATTNRNATIKQFVF
jgi:hypothetical protein